MSYSCTDFTDSILDALNIEVPEESWDCQADQADLALAEIERLQRIEKQADHALAVFDDGKDAELLVARLRVVLADRIAKTKTAEPEYNGGDTPPI